MRRDTLEIDRPLREKPSTAGQLCPAFRFGALKRGMWTFCVLLLPVCGPETPSSRATDDVTANRQNRLSLETSPYLRQHAHNPVDWYPWGPEALERAKHEDRPIFLSIGYSSCYWCHVMEREVFENPTIAARMNTLFVNIKVDREERPDLDAIYMTATQLLSGHGGWPNSIFLTPDLKPFFAGTYFPPTDQRGRPGFDRVIEAVHGFWATRREDVLAQADEVALAIRRVHEQKTASVDLNTQFLEKANVHLQETFDAIHGGFGQAPKFPPDSSLDLLFHVYDRRGDPQALSMVTRTLDAMHRGGIYDQVGGGFHRYATDTQWRIPHFEKMLYTQALLVRAYLRGYVLTGKPAYRRAVEETLEFVLREMRHPSGGFFTALDAETNTVEGAYYVWSIDEITSVISRIDFDELFDLEPLEDLRGVLYRKSNATFDVSAIKGLLALRQQRERPRLDEKIITGWNGLMITAFAEAHQVLGHADYLDVAVEAWEYLQRNHLRPDGRLVRSSMEMVPGGSAFHEDYAYTVQALLTLFRVTNDPTFLDAAKRFAQIEVELFWDGSGGFFFSEGEDVIARRKAIRDSAIPSPNSVSIQNLIVFARATGDTTYLNRAGRALRSFASALERSPGNLPRMVVAGDVYLQAVEDLARRVGVRLLSAERAGDTNWRVTLQVEIAPGWHIQAHTTRAPYLAAAIESVGNLRIVDVYYPEAEAFNPGFEDSPLPVYSGRTRIPVVVDIPPGTTRRKLVLSYQACDEARCLPPNRAVVDLERATIAGDL